MERNDEKKKKNREKTETSFFFLLKAVGEGDNSEKVKSVMKFTNVC